MSEFRVAASLRPELAYMEERITIDAAMKLVLESPDRSPRVALVKESVDELDRQIVSMHTTEDLNPLPSTEDQMNFSSRNEPLDVLILRHSIAVAVSPDGEEEEPPPRAHPEEEEEEEIHRGEHFGQRTRDRSLHVEDIMSTSLPLPPAPKAKMKQLSARARSRRVGALIDHFERMRKPSPPPEPPRMPIVLPNPPDMFKLSQLLNDEIDQILRSK
jgi:hypothetical protein